MTGHVAQVVLQNYQHLYPFQTACTSSSLTDPEGDEGGGVMMRGVMMLLGATHHQTHTKSKHIPNSNTTHPPPIKDTTYHEEQRIRR